MSARISAFFKHAGAVVRLTAITDRKFDSAEGGGASPGVGGLGGGGRLASPTSPPGCRFPPAVKRSVPVSRTHPAIPAARGPSAGDIGAVYPLIQAGSRPKSRMFRSGCIPKWVANLLTTACGSFHAGA